MFGMVQETLKSCLRNISPVDSQETMSTPSEAFTSKMLVKTTCTQSLTKSASDEIHRQKTPKQVGSRGLTLGSARNYPRYALSDQTNKPQTMTPDTLHRQGLKQRAAQLCEGKMIFHEKENEFLREFFETGCGSLTPSVLSSVPQELADFSPPGPQLKDSKAPCNGSIVTTPVLSRAKPRQPRRSLFGGQAKDRALTYAGTTTKRPCPSTSDSCDSSPCKRMKLQTSQDNIKKALTKSTMEGGKTLTGDFARPMSLPLVTGGRHPDLHSIDIHTMADLLNGKFRSEIASFSIIDCRYPYEYTGGHIRGAVNWSHPQKVKDFLSEQRGSPSVPSKGSPRNLLIFHCEFSAERGPKAQRSLREIDRSSSLEHYPALHFPEVYLLEGGYKAFYEAYPELCAPRGYVQMLHEDHREEMKLHRCRSKTWKNKSSRGKLNFSVQRRSFKCLNLE